MLSRSYSRTFRFIHLKHPPPSFKPSPFKLLHASSQSYHLGVQHASSSSNLRHLLRVSPPVLVGYVGFSRGFHASRRNEGLPALAFLLGAFKSSITINYVLGAVRIALTLIPMALLGKHGSRKWIKKLDLTFKDNPEMQAWRPKLMRRLRVNTIAIQVLLFIPTFLFALVVLASLERTPITGRLRLIIMSADEEEGIARDLSGPGWFTAINEVLTTARGPPKFIPPTDWRYMWVERILRRLESVVPVLQDRSPGGSDWFAHTTDELPYPPPPDYPLVPRPRMAQSLHYLEPRNITSEHQSHHIAGDVPPRSVLGPPYSLLVNDQPEQANAFSYGFGPNGSGGVVIFSGCLDEILRSTGGAVASGNSRSTSIPALLTRLFSPSVPPTPPTPTPAQDAQLAVLVAHELAHLLLSHHLETLSSGNIFWPSLTSIVADLFRALLFPITMVGGPFINDALEQVGEVGKREVATAADTCSSHIMEIEADIVSVRLLALAGWDARSATEFWESRINARSSECTGAHAPLPGARRGSLLASHSGDAQSASHPVDALRVQKLRAELVRWETERERARALENKASAAA